MVTKQQIQSLTIGANVMVKLNGELTSATYAGWNNRYDMPNVNIGGRVLPRKVFELGRNNSAPQLELPDVSGIENTESVNPVEEVNDVPPINVRFEYLTQLVTMVATSIPTSLIVVGSGGLGKSYTVFETLRSHGLEEDQDFVVVKGTSTPKSLYRLLYENRDKIVVFDDCDSVLRDATSVNLLKAALDTIPERSVSWRTERGGDDDSSLPASFVFEGKIIFISNYELQQVPQALLSRALHVDVTMTTDEKIERMRHIAPAVNPELPLEVKMEVIELLAEFKHRCRDLNVRTMLKVCSVRIASPGNWRGLAQYVVTSGN
jgi:hypothetical protein